MDRDDIAQCDRGQSHLCDVSGAAAGGKRGRGAIAHEGAMRLISDGSGPPAECTYFSFLFLVLRS